jgi:hypothetical protein
MGVFEGKRSKAKAMAGDLAELWEIPEIHIEGGSGAQNQRNAGGKTGGKTKMKGLQNHRRSGRTKDTW